MTENTETTPEVEPDDYTQTALWLTTEAIIEQARLALSTGEHDVEPLLAGIVIPRVRDAVLMHVITDGDVETKKDALWGTAAVGSPTDAALTSVLTGGKRPNELSTLAIQYLRDVVQYEPAVVSASDDAKAQLYTVGAVLAWWQDDLDLAIYCLDNAGALGVPRLAELVATVVMLGIRPGWVTSA